MLFNRWCRSNSTELLDIAGNMHRLDGAELVKAHSLAPAEEFSDSPGVGRPGIGIADIGGEEFQIPPARLLTGLSDDDRYRAAAASSLIAEEKSSSFFDRPSSLGLPVTSFSPWSGLTRHIMASESFGFPMCSAQFL